MIRDEGKLWPEEGDRLIHPDGSVWRVTYKGPRPSRFGAVADLERADDASETETDTMSIGSLQQRLHRAGWEFDTESNVERSRLDVYHERALEKRNGGDD